jgi:hypothetical protein
VSPFPMEMKFCDNRNFCWDTISGFVGFLAWCSYRQICLHSSIAYGKQDMLHSLFWME